MEAKRTGIEIAELLGVSARTVYRWATEENWPCVQELDNGMVVKRFLVSLLPKDRRLALVTTADSLVAVPAAGELAVVDTELPKLSELKGWQRKVMDARIALFREFQRLERQYGTNAAVKEFCLQAKTERLPDGLQELVPIANARSGKDSNGSRAISKSTIYRWKKMEAQGLVAFAPAAIEKKTIPDWAPYFMECYQIPSNPSIHQAMEEMAKLLPEGVAMPSYSQVRRFHAKRSRLDRERGRKTGSEFKALKGHKVRDTSQLRPLDVGVCDGHSFKARVAHPIHGGPFKPEICAVIDAATRVLVGWSVGLAESATTVADAVRHAATVNGTKRYGGVFNILYTDGGSGNTARINTDEFTGLFPRLGTTHRTGIAGNPQARGIIEIINKTVWIRAAKALPTFVGKDMDSLTERKIYLMVEKDMRQKKHSDVLLSWPQFVEFCGKTVDDYNRRPHSSLPKINDPETGLRRHMSPFEAWAWHAANGWKQEEHQLTEQEIEVLFRPRIERTVQRSMVKIGNSFYYDRILDHYNGEKVQVGYDMHDAERVQIWDAEDRLICHARFEANKVDFYPIPMVEKAANERAKRRAKIKLDQLAEIESERRGTIDTSAGRIIEMTPHAARITVDKAALAKEMQATASAAAITIPGDDKGKFRFWNELDERLAEGGTLEEKEMLFYEAYRKSASYRAFQMVASTLGQQSQL